jgi:CheY-like chemotaxis protein
MSKTILCADDSVTMQKVAEITFRATDFAYVGAKSADEAIQKAKADKPALILADAVMPDKDGYDLCQAIKADPALADVPVVLMCGKSQAYDAGRGSEVGADGHVTKPWDTQAMIDKVGELLDSGGAAKPAASATPAAAKPATPAPKPATPKIPNVPATPATPKIPSIPAAGRSATLMGMPSIKPPMKTPSAPGVTSVTPSAPTPAAKPATPEPVAKPAAPAPAPPPATPAAAAKPATPAPAAKPAAAAAPAGAAIDRPPMIKGIPTKRLKPISAQVAQKVASAAADVARDAGIDPNSPEMQALLKLSADVIERIAWEVVPELAEVMLRDNLPELAAKQ